MSGDSFGGDPYGGDPYQVIPDADPVAAPYGSSSYGSFGYGGSAIDNTLGGMVIRIDAPTPVIASELLNEPAIFAGATEPLPASTFNARDTNIIAGVDASEPQVSGNFAVPGSIAGSISAGEPAVGVELDNQPPLSGAVTEGAPASAGTVEPIIIVGGETWYAHAFNVTDTAPESLFDVFNPGKSFEPVEPLATIDATMQRGELIAFAVDDYQPGSYETRLMLQPMPLLGAIAEPDPLIAGAMADYVETAFSASEAVPAVTASIQNYYIDSAVTEGAPTTTASIQNFSIASAVTEAAPQSSGAIETRVAIRVAATERIPASSAEIKSSASFIVDIAEPLPAISFQNDGIIFGAKEVKPAVSGGLSAGSVMMGAAAEGKPAGSAIIDSPRGFRASVTDKRPVASAVMLAQAGVVAAATERKPAAAAVMVVGTSLSAVTAEPLAKPAARVIQSGSMTVNVSESRPQTVIQLLNVVTVEVAEGDPTAWTLNTEIMASTEYDAFRYQSLACIDGKCYGIKTDGLYLLEGETDAGAAFDSEFMTGEDDADQDRHKRVALVHADVAGNAAMVVAFDGDEHAAVFDGRARFGRGLRGNRLAFGVRSVEGSRFKVRSIEPVVEILKKRVA